MLREGMNAMEVEGDIKTMEIAEILAWEILFYITKGMGRSIQESPKKEFLILINFFTIKPAMV